MANGNIGDPEPTKKTRGSSASMKGQRNNAPTRRQHVKQKGGKKEKKFI